MNRREWRKITYLFSIAAAIFLIGTLLYKTDLLRPVERFILDFKFRYIQREDPNEKIALVTIDEKSLSYFNQNGIYWPWPREFYYRINEYMSAADAELVLYDILFDTPGFDRANIDGRRSDTRFARSLNTHDNGILAFKSTPAQQVASPSVQSLDSPYLYSIDGSNPNRAPHVLTSFPISKFQSAATGLGNTILQPDPDGIIRSVHLFDSLAHQGFAPMLAMSAYLHMQPETPEIKWTQNGIAVGDLNIPLVNGNRYLVNWYSKGGVEKGTFPYYSFHEVIQSAIEYSRDSSASVSVPPSAFENKVVIVGASAAGLGDIKSTPMSSLEPFPGMEIQATVLNNLIGQNFITTLPGWIMMGLLFLLTFGIIFLVAYTRPLTGAVSIGTTLLVILGIGIGLFYSDRIWFPTGLSMIMALLSYISSSTYKYFAEERQKQKIRSAFDQYVQPEFVDQLIKKPEMLKLGGDNKRLTVLFSDLAGFTSISESTPPEELIQFLNHYLGTMTDTILAHKGTLDKYIGDAVMAFWGAPIDQNDHAEQACRSTLRMIEKLDRMNEESAHSDKPYTYARFGLNTGEMVVGNIGSHNRFNYTVLGDAVNLAARLESANKKFGTKVLISESTYEQLPDDFVCRLIDLIVVKGKSEPVRAYELLADRHSNADLNQLQIGLECYQNGLDAYYRREWDGAIEHFQKVFHHFPDDGPAQTYIERCKQFREHPPGENWDGVFHLQTK